MGKRIVWWSDRGRRNFVRLIRGRRLAFLHALARLIATGAGDVENVFRILTRRSSGCASESYRVRFHERGDAVEVASP